MVKALQKSGASIGLVTIATAILLVAGCAMTGNKDMSDQSMHSSSTSMDETSMDKSGMSDQSMNDSMAMDDGSMNKTNRFGGPVYTGKPALPVTVALIMAGGGPEDFSFVTALNNMLGPKTVKAEVAKLKQQYGADRVKNWITVMNFYVNDALQIIQKKGIKLPPPADLSGVELAKTLIKAGTGPNGTFWAGYLFDHALSHPIHNQLMTDADVKYSAAWDGNAHAITNQAFYDVAQALGMNNVKLASLH